MMLPITASTTSFSKTLTNTATFAAEDLVDTTPTVVQHLTKENAAGRSIGKLSGKKITRCSLVVSGTGFGNRTT